MYTISDIKQIKKTTKYVLPQEPNEEPNEVDSSDDSEDESDSDSDESDETDSESKSDDYEVMSDIIKPIEVKLELTETKQIPINEMVIELEVDPIIVLKKEKEEKEENVKLIEVSDDESSVKQVTVDNEFSQLSLKELKQKVNDLGGPALKTKQALINFLKKKYKTNV